MVTEGKVRNSAHAGPSTKGVHARTDSCFLIQNRGAEAGQSGGGVCELLQPKICDFQRKEQI